MPTMNVSLTKKLADFVESEVAAGDYASASEVVRDALRLLENERENEEAKREALRAAIDVGIADLEAGRVFEGTVDDILQDVLRRARERS